MYSCNDQRSAEELSSYQKKIIGLDQHLALALAGLAADARVLSNFMRQQALGSKMTYGRPIPVERIVNQIGDRAQQNTQIAGKRPYGVGLLIAGVDDTGPHLFEFQPSGVTHEMVACAIGARSQMARTYLERHLSEFENASREELIKHGLKALKESLPQDKELTVDSTSVGVVGKPIAGKKKIESFKLYDGAEMEPLLEGIAESTEGQATAETEGAQGGGATSTEAGGDSMDVDS